MCSFHYGVDTERARHRRERRDIVALDAERYRKGVTVLNAAANYVDAPTIADQQVRRHELRQAVEDMRRFNTKSIPTYAVEQGSREICELLPRLDAWGQAVEPTE